MKSYAFIFARGGSKGLPRKNILNLDGKPLINYSIDLAKKCKDIDKIFISTDDEEISAIASKNGAEVINRPDYLAQDNSSEWLSWQHAIKFVNDKYGSFSNFISLPTTSPLREVEDVEKAIKRLNSNNLNDICISYSESYRNPYFNMIKINNNGNLKLVCDSDDTVSRRQDAPLTFDITTVVYAAKPEYILQNKAIFDGAVVGIEIPKVRSIDIDDIHDFKYAEFLIKNR
jgi:CMP-N-acetylneuraminic acid synthetase